ncbi:hypothetical protein [Photobacterium carnosum]|uniref:hypothetical protein n=1 Tax=Photobacterium carnosum TaxID=2023717 RepID=UPI001E2D4491|nr:hypothetical protein [Photobacterium carnosum]MCD9530676.1 hypothetical protein [Photobacterium carnosum]MCF2155119.1 hypothetical protein [Photobacterium carnosum]MCF2216407.1 hypothetical protein [Photobacterium carnosum]
MRKVDQAYDLYKKHIYDAEKVRLLKENNLKVAGHVHSVIWELFAAILTGRKAEGITGADLLGWEVKSAKDGGSFEYQYHRNSYLSKLDEDCKVNHLYCSYGTDYSSLEVRAMRGDELNGEMSDWKALCIENYNQGKLRFRKSINYGYVKQHGLLVLTICQSELVFREDNFEEVLRNR